MLNRIAYLSLSLMAFAVPAQAQHSHEARVRSDTKQTTTHSRHTGNGSAVPHEMGDMAGHEDMDMTGSMPGMMLPGVPMAQEASGTSWQPGTTPVEAVHAQAGGWNLMFHGNAYARATAQDFFGVGERGGRQFDIPNWFMGMASRSIGSGGLFGARAMISLDPITVGGNGYPLLFQTGETFEGQPLIDRQHPHDLFSELAVSYGQQIGDRAGVFAYFGLPGEPALGPAAFMHRASAMHLPDSPLGHHWQDATHILFGVATLGVRYGNVKLDGSVFTGREPDENRYGIDTPRFDSYSLRLTANPTDRLSVQASRAFLKSPEVLEPESDQWRTTASLMYNAPFRTYGGWSNTLVWGLNQPAGGEEGHASNLSSLLAESDLDFGSSAAYTRLEWVQKDGHELGIDPPPFDAEPVLRQDDVFNIGSWTLGFARDVATFGDFKAMVGLQASVYRVPPDLKGGYGDFPFSGQVYLRFSPTRMLMGHGGMQEHSGHAMLGM